MSNVAQTFTTIGAIVGILGLLIGIQSYWISRALDRVDRRIDRLDDRVDTGFAEVKDVLLKDHGERIRALEERVS